MSRYGSMCVKSTPTKSSESVNVTESCLTHNIAPCWLVAFASCFGLRNANSFRVDTTLLLRVDSSARLPCTTTLR